MRRGNQLEYEMGNRTEGSTAEKGTLKGRRTGKNSDMRKGMRVEERRQVKVQDDIEQGNDESDLVIRCL